jgi:SAM-dependent methyltransferase
VPEFSEFDSRGYATLDPRAGYARWSAGYEHDVEDEMDIALLEALETPAWERTGRAADLGCGTGRTAAWLKRRGVRAVDGVDLTPEMLALARERGAHEALVEAEVTETGLESSAYDLVISCLVDEHLPDPAPLHAEAWRLARPGGSWVLVGFHPHFIMAAGIPTHFEDEAGEPIAIRTHVHLVSEQITAAIESGWRLVEMRERLVDERWIERKPQWERWRGHPVSVAYAWRKPAADRIRA